MRRLYRLIRLPAEDRSALMRAFHTLAAWRVGLWLFPVGALRRRARPAGRLQRPMTVERVEWAVNRAARYVPGATCLTQALAAQSLLRRSGHASQLHIGVARGPGREFGAHAWLQCHDRVVIGGTDLDRYTPLLAWKERP